MALLFYQPKQKPMIVHGKKKTNKEYNKIIKSKNTNANLCKKGQWKDHTTYITMTKYTIHAYNHKAYSGDIVKSSKS